MESSLIQISDMWLKLKPTSIVVLGNGATRESGMDFAQTNSLPVIAINDIPEGLNTIFSVVTNKVLLKEIVHRNSNSIPLVVPSSFPKIENCVPLQISEFEYLEGTTNNVDGEIHFREDFVLLTILDVLDWLVFKNSSNQIEVNLFGFDFEVNEDIENINGNQFLDSMLSRQKSIFSMLLSDIKMHKNLRLINRSRELMLAKDPETYLTIDKSIPKIEKELIHFAIQKNIELQQEMFQRALAGDVLVVAELTNNHLGDTSRLIQMVEECKRQGADVIKIQKRDIDFLYTQEERDSFYKSPFGNTLGEYRQGVELTFEQIEYLTVRCSELEIPWFSSVLDIPSLKLIEQFKPICVKAPSTISNHKNFLRAIADSDVQFVFISTGATNADFMTWVVDNFASKNLVLMQCTSSYPTAPEDSNVAVVQTIKELKSTSKVIPGFSSHDIGSLASQMSVAFGAKFIEKHIKLGSVDWVHFDGVALDLSKNSLRRFVDDIKLAQKVIGSAVKRQLTSEHHKYKPNEKNN